LYHGISFDGEFDVNKDAHDTWLFVFEDIPVVGVRPSIHVEDLEDEDN